MARANILLLLACIAATARPTAAGAQKNAKRCTALLEKLWQATQPAREVLGLAKVGRLRDDYGRAEGFHERCLSLRPQELACLEDHPRSLLAFSDCLPPQDRGQPQALRPPSLLGLIEESSPPASAYTSEQLARLLEGGWRNSWPEGRSRVFWRINRRGRIAETRWGPDGNITQRHLLITGGSEGWLQVDTGDGRLERWPWLRLGPRRMIVGRHLPHALLAPFTEGRARLKYRRLLLSIEEERCLVIGDAGALAPALCRWEQEKSRRRLLVEWQHPETGAPGRAVFYLLADHLVEDKLVRSGWFEKKP